VGVDIAPPCIPAGIFLKPLSPRPDNRVEGKMLVSPEELNSVKLVLTTVVCSAVSSACPKVGKGALILDQYSMFIDLSLKRIPLAERNDTDF
jgi:hypothetical protein